MEQQNGGRAKTLIEVDVNDIEIFIDRERDQERHEWFQQNLKKLGQIDPIAITKNQGGSRHKYKLVYGQGRLEAAKKTGIRKILAFLCSFTNEIEFYQQWFSENRMRRPLNPYDQAKLMKKDKDEGLTLSHIAEKYNISKGYAANMIQLIERASPKIIERLSKETKHKKLKGKPLISTGRASEITSAFPEEHDQEEILNTLDQMNIKDTSEFRAILRVAKKEKRRSKLITTQELIKAVNKMKVDLENLNDWILTHKERIDRLTSALRRILGDFNLRGLLEKYSIQIPENII